MDRLPVIARLQYDTVAQYLLSVFEQALTQYDQGINLGAGVSPTREVRQQLLTLEGRMTWLTYMVASVIGNLFIFLDIILISAMTPTFPDIDIKRRVAVTLL